MKCPRCGSLKTKVVDSRKVNGFTRRARSCDDCYKWFYTVEIPEAEYIALTQPTRKPVAGFEGLYEVDVNGNVFSVCQTASRRVRRLKPYTVSGYKKVRLYGKNGQVSRYFIHRLVAQAFIPNPDNLPEVNHKDCDHTNNHVSNLEWVSREQNLQHSYDSGMKREGEKHGMHKLTLDQVREIRNSTESDKVLAERYGVVRTTIWAIRKGRLWKGVI